MTQTSDAPLLSVSGLSKSFVRRNWVGRPAGRVDAVADVDLRIAPGRTLGIVGESGCGKSTTGRLILRLIEADAGRIMFDGIDLRQAEGETLRRLRRDMQLVFQDPYSSLNPRLTVGTIISEGLVAHGIGHKSERRDRVAAVLRRVGLRPEFMDRYANEFSGGQRQRIGIARALVLKPKLVVADEPVSALDVSVQAQVLNLIAEIQQDLGLTTLFIAHDIAVVEHVSEEIAVMYRGRVVEHGPTEAIIADPLHPYTRLLLSSVPLLDPHAPRRPAAAAAQEAGATDHQPATGGCAFYSRCPARLPHCRVERPPLVTVGEGRRVACHRAPAAPH